MNVLVPQFIQKLCLDHTVVWWVQNSIMSKKLYIYIYINKTLLLKSVNTHLAIHIAINFQSVKNSVKQIALKWGMPVLSLSDCILCFVFQLLSHILLFTTPQTVVCPSGSSVHGIFQARILGWVAISFSRGSSWPRDRTRVSCVCCIGRWILYHWATWEALKKLRHYINT